MRSHIFLRTTVINLVFLIPFTTLGADDFTRHHLLGGGKSQKWKQYECSVELGDSQPDPCLEQKFLEFNESGKVLITSQIHSITEKAWELIQTQTGKIELTIGNENKKYFYIYFDGNDEMYLIEKGPLPPFRQRVYKKE